MNQFAIIVSGNIKNQEKVDAYKSIAGPIMKKYGATMPPQSYRVSEIVAGQASPSFMLKIEFPDRTRLWRPLMTLIIQPPSKIEMKVLVT